MLEFQCRVYNIAGDLCFSDLEKFIECITGFSHHLGDCVIHGIATSQSTAQIESGEALSNLCRASGESGLSVLGAIEKGKTRNIHEKIFISI